MSFGIIYKITNKVNGHIYIGQTIRTIEERFSEHKRKKKSYISKALRHYGFENFIIEKIDNENNIEELNNKEYYWIKFCNCIHPNGYNLCDGGGNTSNYHHTEESKQKMSNSKKGKYMGENNPFFGKTHSDDIKLLLSKQRKGRKLTEEWKKNVGIASQRKVINLDTKEIFNSINNAAKKYNLKSTHISRVCRGKRIKTGGFKWMYYDEYIKQNSIPLQIAI